MQLLTTQQFRRRGIRRGFIRSNPAFIITLIYIWVSVIGGLQANLHFSQYGIEVFDFAEANDFLLVAFSRPWSLLVSTMSLLTVVSFVLLVSRLSAKIKDVPMAPGGPRRGVRK